jgi:hypothetical protein
MKHSQGCTVAALRASEQHVETEMIENAKWAFSAVIWPPATKQARRTILSSRKWGLLVDISFLMICWTLLIGLFLMSFFAPDTGNALWIGVVMCGVAAYYAYLLYVFGWQTEAE